MLNFFSLYIETVFTALHYPSDLVGLLSRRALPPGFSGLVILLPAASLATGSYLMRDFYPTSFAYELIFYLLSHYILLVLWGVALGSLVNSISAFRMQSPRENSRIMIRISMSSLIPFGFATPAAITFSRFDSSGIYYLAALAILLGWSLYIIFQGSKYLYEMANRKTFEILLLATGTAILFPLLFSGFIIMGFLELNL